MLSKKERRRRYPRGRRESLKGAGLFGITGKERERLSPTKVRARRKAIRINGWEPG
jgi:hypothetical protein